MGNDQEGFGPLLSFLKRHWGKLLFIALFGKAFLLSLPLLIGFAISVVDEKLNDEKSVKSVHLGREIKIAPFASLVKMKKYGGWMDKYLYIFATPPEYKSYSGPEAIETLSDYAVFKIIDVKVMTGKFLGGGGKIVCIMQNVHNKKQIASEDCDELDAIEELSEVYQEAESSLEKSGNVFISSEKRGPGTFTKILDVNSFSVYKISSKEELHKFLLEDLGSLSAYKYVIGSREPYLLHEEEIHNERKIATLLKTTGFADSWESKHFGDTKLRDYLNKNEIPDEVENWINLNYTNPKDRWVLRTLTSFLQRMILDQKKMKPYEAQKRLPLFKEVTRCMNAYFEDRTNFKEHVKKLQDKFLEDPERLLKYKKVLELANTPSSKGSNYYPIGCRNFSPPNYVAQ